MQAHIIYSGTVQGVGFRYTTHDYAVSLNLQGWVKNLSDGSVEIVVEGSKDSIEQLCQKVENHFKGYIHGRQIDWKESRGEFSEFKIAF